jgi:hypothetical protein
MPPKKLAATALLSLTALACGSFSDDPGAPTTLATIRGQVNIPAAMAAPSDFRVALVWSGVQYNIASELPVVGEFPAQFQIEIHDLPPEDAFHSAETEPNYPPPGDLRVAYGAVLGYEDLNHNQRLDLVDENATEFIDRVVATNPDMLVVFAEGSDEAFAEAARDLGLPSLPRGFSLLRLVESTPEVSSPPEFLPITASYDLAISDDPRMNEQMCLITPESGSGGSGGLFHEGRPEVYPSPTDPNLTCYEDGAWYTYTLTCRVVEDGLCRGSFEVCNFEAWTRPDPVPSDWPCPG